MKPEEARKWEEMQREASSQWRRELPRRVLEKIRPPKKEYPRRDLDVLIREIRELLTEENDLRSGEIAERLHPNSKQLHQALLTMINRDEIEVIAGLDERDHTILLMHLRTGA